MAYALVVGEGNGPRSAAMREIAEALARRHLRVAGFTQRIVEEGPGRKAVDVIRLREPECVRLARTTIAPGAADAVCSFAFDAAAFEEARRWIEEDAVGADVLLLDGLGKLELGGGGHRRAIGYALRAGPPVILSVREGDLVYALEGLALGDPLASYGTAEGAEALLRFLDAVGLAARTRVRGAREAASET